MKTSRLSRALCSTPYKTTTLQHIHKPLLATSFSKHLSPVQPRPQFSPPQPLSLPRFLSYTSTSRISLTPEASKPAPPPNESKNKDLEASDISESEYHEKADQYLDKLVSKLEEMVESEQNQGLEVEFSAGVLTLTHPENGTYVLNKQPPNKQIWLSSPVSGPKRYDWVLHHDESDTSSSGGGMGSKQDTEGATGGYGDDGVLGGGKWIYLRDGTGLSDLLRGEVGVVVVGGEGAGN